MIFKNILSRGLETYYIRVSYIKPVNILGVELETNLILINAII